MIQSDNANSRPTNDVLAALFFRLRARWIEFGDRLRRNPKSVAEIACEPGRQVIGTSLGWRRATYLPFAGGADRGGRDGDRWREMPGGRTKQAGTPHFQERSGAAALIVI